MTQKIAIKYEGTPSTLYIHVDGFDKAAQYQAMTYSANEVIELLEELITHLKEKGLAER